MPSNSSFGLVQIAVLVEGVRHQAVAHGAQGNRALALRDYDTEEGGLMPVFAIAFRRTA